jgi:hypothetical protein
MTTLSYKNIDIDNIELSNPDKLDNCYICNINYSGSLLYIQTPVLSIDEITKEYIILNINDIFSKFIDDLEDNNIKYTFEHCEEWFNKDIPYDAIENMYENIDLENNKLKINFPYIKEKIQCKIYNNDKKNIEHSELSEDDNIVLILHIKGLKILKEKFYLDFYVNQIKLVNNEYTILSEYSIIDDEELDYLTIDDLFDEEINNVIEEDKLKKEKEKDLKKKMEELENELKKLNN